MPPQKNILVTGANGQLGNEFRVLSATHVEFNFTFAGREDVSICDAVSLDALFSSNHFDCCINCAAYTAVDKAESEQEEAFKINATAVGLLAGICKKNKTQFIHISTDYVFDGNKPAGYLETDSTGPVSVYGASKLQGELEALKNNPSSIIIRTSWVYSSFGKNFLKTMLRLMSEKSSIGVVNDQVGSPTYAADLAEAILTIINSDHTSAAGIYHYCNEGTVSWYDFAEEIKKISHRQCVVHPIETTAYPTPARRPKFSILDTNKIRQTFGIEIPSWKSSLHKCYALIEK